MTDRQGHPRHRAQNIGGASLGERRWPTYLWITALLLFILVALAGGIIWYNSKKSSELALSAAQRLMQQADEKIRDRIKLLYDPMYAIVGIATLVPGLTTPAIKDDPSAMALMQRALRIYPQILSLYVGFDNGDFFMLTHIAGEKASALRKALQAPAEAVFANEVITTNAAGADGRGREAHRAVGLPRQGWRHRRAPRYCPRGLRSPSATLVRRGRSAPMWSSTVIFTSSLRAANPVSP